MTRKHYPDTGRVIAKRRGRSIGSHERILDAALFFETEAELAGATAALERHGFEVTVLDFVLDEAPRNRWAKAAIEGDLSIDAFLDLVEKVIKPFDCIILEAGPAYRPPTQLEVLAAIGGGGATEQEIRGALGIDHWTLAPVLRDLEACGAVRRVGGRLLASVQ
jgi:hypothetical protein